MSVRFFIGFTFIVSWTYFSIAYVTQQHAEIQFFDERYFSEVKAFTSRRKRGDPYLTNITFASLVGVDNNVTVKVVADVKSVGSIVFFEMKCCDSYKVPWVRQAIRMYTNYTDCPIPPGRYQMFNLEIPPKNFPLPVPKGEGTLHMYGYLTRNMQLILHGLMKVVST